MRSGFRAVIFCAPGALLLAALGSWTALALGCGAIGLLWLLQLKSLVWPELLTVETDVTVSLAADAWRTSSDSSYCRRHWSTLDRLQTTRDHLFLFIGEVVAFVIPRRAFATADESEAFAEQVRRYQSEAVRTEPGDRPAWPEADPPIAATFSDPERVGRVLPAFSHPVEPALLGATLIPRTSSG